jgi:hypothetical protein
MQKNKFRLCTITYAGRLLLETVTMNTLSLLVHAMKANWGVKA